MADLSLKKSKGFVKYGRWDSPETARNGLKGSKTELLAKARVELYKVHQKAKGLINGKPKDRKKDS